MKYLIMVIIAAYLALFIGAAFSADTPTKVCSYRNNFGVCVYIQT
jgi:hypothetical protein